MARGEAASEGIADDGTLDELATLWSTTLVRLPLAAAVVERACERLSCHLRPPEARPGRMPLDEKQRQEAVVSVTSTDPEPRKNKDKAEENLAQARKELKENTELVRRPSGPPLPRWRGPVAPAPTRPPAATSVPLT